MTCYSLGVPQVVVNVAESPLLVVLEGKATKKVCGHLGCRADNGRKSLIVSDGPDGHECYREQCAPSAASAGSLYARVTSLIQRPAPRLREKWWLAFRGSVRPRS